MVFYYVHQDVCMKIIHVIFISSVCWQWREIFFSACFFGFIQNNRTVYNLIIFTGQFLWLASFNVYIQLNLIELWSLRVVKYILWKGLSKKNGFFLENVLMRFRCVFKWNNKITLSCIHLQSVSSVNSKCELDEMRLEFGS